MEQNINTSAAMPISMRRLAKFKVIVKLYKWRLLLLALTLTLLLIARGNTVIEAAKLPPGSVPTPDIDPL